MFYKHRNRQNIKHNCKHYYYPSYLKYYADLIKDIEHIPWKIYKYQ